MSAKALSPDEDDPLGRAVDTRLLRRLLATLRPHRRVIAVAVVILMAASALELLEPWLVKVAIDRYVTRLDASGLPVVGALYMLVLVLVFALRYVEDYLTATIGQRASLDLRARIFRHLQALHVRYFDRTPVGRVMTRVVGDVDALNEMFTSGVVAIFGDVFMLVGIVAAMLLLDARLALAAFLVLPGVALATQVFRVKVRFAFREVRGKLARVNAFLQEELSGMSVVKLFRREEVDCARFDRVNAEHRDAHLRTVLYHSIYYPVIEVLGALAVGLLVYRGGGLLGAGTLTLGVLVAFIQYAKRFFQPIMDLSEKYNILQSAMASSERIFELLDTKPVVESPLHPLAIPPGRPGIELESVSFAYDPGHPVLSDVSFVVKPGTTVAVVGATGAGKSTLASLVLRFHDVTAGAVKVGGIDVREVDPRALRRRVAYVQQDVFLFSGSIADNIRLGSGLSDARVEEAARAAAVSRFVEPLPQGYATDVQERGNRLSAGQKQLVALARALAFDPDVLLLDEATSSVDTVTEALLQEAIERLSRGRTALVIAHRLSTVRNADTIVVLHKGRVREMGTHEELLGRGGLYRKLFELQFGAPVAGSEGPSLASVKPEVLEDSRTVPVEESPEVNGIDIVLGALLLTAALLGLVGGLVRIAFAVVSLAIGGVAAAAFASAAAGLLRGLVSSPELALLLGFVGVYALVLICFSLLGLLLRRFVSKLGLGWADRLFGALLALALVLVAASLVAFAALRVAPTAHLVAGSWAIPRLAALTEAVAEHVPAHVRDEGRRVFALLEERIARRTAKKAPGPGPAAAETEKVEKASATRSRSKVAHPARSPSASPSPAMSPVVARER